MDSDLSKQKMTALLREVRSLFENGLYESSILLGSLLVSLFKEGFPKACARTVLGHALRADGQFKRALYHYQEALHELNRLRGNLPAEVVSMMTDDGDVAMSSANNVEGDSSFWFMASASGMGEENSSMQYDPLGVSEDATTPLGNVESAISLSEKKRRRRSMSPQSPIGSLARFSANIKFRMAQSHKDLGQEEAAISVLEGIPREEMSGAALALLGKLKRRLGAKGGVGFLKESLAKEPFALEVILTLLEMDTAVEEVISLVTLNGKRSIACWMEQLIRAHAAVYTNQQRDAMQRFSQLSSKVFPANPHILSSLAKLELDSGNREAALSHFARARSVDPLALENSDIYAGLLRSIPDRTKLVQLTHELLNTGGRCQPEPWVAAALLSDMRNDKDKALVYVSRATELDPLHVPALHVKGSLLLNVRRPMESLSTFARALAIRRDFTGLKGLVDAYLNMQPPKVGDAVTIAQEAIQLLPKDPRPCILMGKALAARPSSEKLAVEFLQRALKLDSSTVNIAACASLADVRLSQFRRGEIGRDTLIEVATMLSKCTHSRGMASVMSHDQLYCKIGTLFAYAGDKCRALENYHDALSVNSSSKDARDALEALETVEPPMSEERPRRSSTLYHQQQISPVRRSPPSRLTESSPTSPEGGRMRGVSPHPMRRRMAGAPSVGATRRLSGGGT